jgi:UTP--glucose-1-phosphate uridylyltransferase
MQKVKKAVFPVAGMGTRFLPATKASPKEMLPIVDKPLIQYAVEEAVAAGITDMIFVSRRSKRAIEDHFDKAYELESELAARGKDRDAGIRPVTFDSGWISTASISGSRSAGPRARRAVRANPLIGDEPFAVLLADDLIDGEPDCDEADDRYQYDYYQCSVLGVQDVPRADNSQLRHC